MFSPDSFPKLKAKHQKFLILELNLKIPGDWSCRYLPWTSLIAQLVKNLPSMQETPVQSLGQEDPLKKQIQYSWASLVARPVNLPAMWESWVRSLDWEDPLEKGRATYPSILAWRTPWTSMGSQRVRHDFHFNCWKASLVAQTVKNLPAVQEKGMATHCSNLAWRIPWTEEPGGR